MPPAGRCRCTPIGRCRHRLFWQRFGDTLAHRVLIQAPQPRLHPGLREAQGQPSAGKACARPAIIDTSLRKPNRQLIQSPVTARKIDLSLISYQAFSSARIKRPVWPFTGQALGRPQPFARLLCTPLHSPVGPRTMKHTSLKQL